jgi:hypothetical protein
MVQLVKPREVFRIDRLFEVTLEAFKKPNGMDNQTIPNRLGTCRIRFLVVRSQDLEIRLPSGDQLDLDVIEDDSSVWRAAPYGGRYLTRIQALLARNAFLDDSSMERYIQENVRFRIASSNYPDNLVEIDYQKGYYHRK